MFGLAPLIHTRFSALAASLKEGGTRGATGAARHHVRRGLVMAEVALAVMLVIGAGLLLRTVYNLSTVDAGFDRSRLVTFQMSLPPASYPQPPARAQLYQRLLERLRALPGVQGASAMSGLPPKRQVNANDTEIDNYTAPPEGPFENVDYYQNVMTDYFETMGIPIVAGPRLSGRPTPPRRAWWRWSTRRWCSTFWKDLNPIGQRLRPVLRRSSSVVHRHRRGEGREAGRRRSRRPAPSSTSSSIRPPIAPPFGSAPGTMNIVLRTTLPPATLARRSKARARGRPRRPVVRLRDMNEVFDGIDQAAAPAGAASRRLRGPGAAAGRDRHLRRALLHGRRAPARDRHPHGARRRAGRGTGAGPEAGTDAGRHRRRRGPCRRVRADRLIASLLFGVQPTDPTTMAAVVGTIAAVAALACLLPAWRASRVDPIVVPRDE